AASDDLPDHGICARTPVTGRTLHRTLIHTRWFSPTKLGTFPTRQPGDSTRGPRSTSTRVLSKFGYIAPRTLPVPLPLPLAHLLCPPHPRCSPGADTGCCSLAHEVRLSEINS